MSEAAAEAARVPLSAPRETIVAPATPPGRGGIGVVRISGPDAAALARALLGEVPPPREARHLPFRDPDGEVIDRGVALYFPAPGSYTGEDVLELQAHGSPVVLDQIVAAATRAGARFARPGEFSERAFLNARLDLAQAEAVADLIGAASATAARAARRTLEGELSRRAGALADGLAACRCEVEAAIDFADEDGVDAPLERKLRARLERLAAGVEALRAEARDGQVLTEGVAVVIVGPPNAGKSSVLNRLAGRERAIVTAVPGTTRDLVEAEVDIGGVALRLTDTAGLRESADEVEREGIRRAREALEGADLVLFVVEDAAGATPAPRTGVPLIRVRNKIDLGPTTPGWSREAGGAEVRMSALTGAGEAALRAALAELAGIGRAGEATFSARRRHLEALAETAAALASGRERVEAIELLAEDLRRAQRALGELTGEFTSEDLLDRIFSTFCIGK